MSRSSLLLVLSGALGAGYLVIALFFLKFRSRTHDRLFGYFAAAFVLLAAQRLGIAIGREWEESSVWLYGLRLLAFLLLIFGIVEKNRSVRPSH